MWCKWMETLYVIKILNSCSNISEVFARSNSIISKGQTEVFSPHSLAQMLTTQADRFSPEEVWHLRLFVLCLTLQLSVSLTALCCMLHWHLYSVWMQSRRWHYIVFIYRLWIWLAIFILCKPHNHSQKHYNAIFHPSFLRWSRCLVLFLQTRLVIWTIRIWSTSSHMGRRRTKTEISHIQQLSFQHHDTCMTQ